MGFMVPYRTEQGEIVLDIVYFGLEGLVALLSFVAAIHHIRRSGWRPFKKKTITSSRLTYFHLTHLLYCLSVMATNLSYPYLGAPSPLSCSGWNGFFFIFWIVTLNIVWSLTLYLFFGHFERLFITDLKQLRAYDRLRTAFYGIWIVTGVIVYSVLQVRFAGQSDLVCLQHSIKAMLQLLLSMSILALLELGLLIRRYWLYVHLQHNPAKRDISSIVALIINWCGAIAAIVTYLVSLCSPRFNGSAESLTGDYDDGEVVHYQRKWLAGAYSAFVLHFIPFSYTMLGLTFEAHYLSLRLESTDARLTELALVEAGQRAAAAATLAGEDVENPIFETAQDDKVSADMASRGLVRLSVPRKGTVKFEDVHIAETLEPPYTVFPTTLLFLSRIALPFAEAQRTRHEAEAKVILDLLTPDQGIGTARGRKEFQMQKLKEQLSKESEEVGQWLAVLKHTHTAMQRQIEEDNGDAHLAFKPSKSKGLIGVALLPTNLQRHSFLLECRSSSAKTIATTCLTYGAPAAHIFKFKGGGLGRAEAKLAKQGEKQSAQSLLLPDDMVARLRLKFVVSGRACVAVSQALAALVAAVVDSLEGALAARGGGDEREANSANDAAAAAAAAAARRVAQWRSADVGMLVHEVSLLSTHGKEEGMLDDMASALNRLRVTVRIVSPPQPDSASSSAASDSGSGSGKFRVLDVAPKELFPQQTTDLGPLVVTLSAHSSEDYHWLESCVPPLSNGDASEPTSVDIEISPVLMTLGVNEFQTIANATNSTELQTEVNRRGVEELRRYHESFRAFQERLPPVASESDAAVECDGLLSRLSELVEEEAAGTRRKIVDLLLVSCYAARLMHGARTTSCKSAKDRTSVFQTLESVRWAQRRGALPASDPSAAAAAAAATGGAGGAREVRLLELLRGRGGVRLQNCGDNIGKTLYTFNALQISQLPPELQPRSSVSGAGQS